MIPKCYFCLKVMISVFSLHINIYIYIYIYIYVVVVVDNLIVTIRDEKLES